jgi:hypothetical protein
MHGIRRLDNLARDELVIFWMIGTVLVVRAAPFPNVLLVVWAVSIGSSHKVFLLIARMND